MKRINLDHAATAPMLPEALEAMVKAYQYTGNPSAAYTSGREAHAMLERARAQTAAALGCAAAEVCFTSGGTESDNWALRGALVSTGKRCLITSAIEHPAVLHTAAALEREGVEVIRLPVSRDGVVSVEALASALRERPEDVALVSVMTANNETGALQPVREIGALCHQAGVLFHTDAVQAAGAVANDLYLHEADLISISAHKFGGPKGIGALIVRNGVRLPRWMEGGAQERGRRPGTENMPGAVGLAAALSAAEASRETRSRKLTALRDYFESRLLAAVPGAYRHGPEHARLPGHCQLCFPGVDGRALLMRLDMAGVEASIGSACASGSVEPSHVLLAMGCSREEALASMRFSLGVEHTWGELDEAADIIIAAVHTLLGMR